MDLYFSPLACSLATRISLYEAGAESGFIEVDPKTKRIMSNGSDYTKVYPLGMVPAIRMDDGALLTENAAILQYVAAQFPDANLAPKDGVARARRRPSAPDWHQETARRHIAGSRHFPSAARHHPCGSPGPCRGDRLWCSPSRST